MKSPTGEDKDWALAFVSTKTTKRPVDLITLSTTLERLEKAVGIKELAEKLGIHREMVREFLNVKKLPDEIKQIVSKREIDSIDTVTSILKLKSTDEQILLANASKEMKSAEIRDVVKLVKVGKVPITEAIEKIKTGRRGMTHLFFVSLDDLHFIKLKELARKVGENEPVYLERIVRDLIDKLAKEVK